MPLRYLIRQARVFFIYRVLHVDDTPHRIALGVAMGIFIAWTPTIGIQMVLTILLSALLGANKLVGVPFVWISNPFTAPFIYYYTNFKIGRWMLGGNYQRPNFFKAFKVSGSWWLEVWVNRIQAWWQATWDVFAPMWLGSLVMATVLAVTTYFAVRHAVIAYRRHRSQKRSLPQA